MSGKDLMLKVHLFAEGDRFFDMLKAVVRDWQNAPWPHERERAAYAMELYQRGLSLYRQYLEEARVKAEQGFNTLLDQKLVGDMEQKLSYWEKKLSEITAK